MTLNARKKKTSFDVDEAVFDDIKKISDLLGVKQSDLLRDAVDFYIEHLFLLPVYIIDRSRNDPDLLTIERQYINIEDVQRVKTIDVPREMVQIGFNSYGKIRYKKEKETVEKTFASNYLIDEDRVEKLIEVLKKHGKRKKDQLTFPPLHNH